MAKLRELQCQNEWWNSYGPRVNSIMTIIEEKRFQNTYEGDVNYTEIIFVVQGLVFALEKAQIDADARKGALGELNSFKDAIASLNDKINEMKKESDERIKKVEKEFEDYKIEAEVTIANLQHNLDKDNSKQEDMITD